MARFGVGAYDALYAVEEPVICWDGPWRRLRVAPAPSRSRWRRPNGSPGWTPATDTWPLHVRGRVLGRVPQPFAVAVNGLIVATTRMYQERGASMFGTMIPESAIRAGHNDVEIFLIERTGGTTTLITTVR